jgi:phenylacetate-CoA ligase
MSPDELRNYQEKKLLAQISYCVGTSDFYRRRFAEIGVDPRDIRSMDDYFDLPIIIDKEQERISQQESLESMGHPFGMHLCCNPEDVGITATTSGTTGVPTFTYTLARDDLGMLNRGFASMMGHAGILPGERILFAHALGVYATSAILPPLRAAGYIPIDVDVRGGADSVIQFAELTKPVAMMTTPSLAQFLIDRMRDRTGREVRSLKLRAIFVVGEIGVGIPEIKKKIEDAYGCRVYDWIAPVGQTLAFSCDSEQYHGMHAVTPDTDLYPMDLVDPASRKRVEPVNGAEGEAVYTSLSRKALPVLRFGSGDLVRIETNECPCCGFKGNRVRVVGRADDMLIVKGTNVYPAAIRTVINEFIPAVSGQMRIVLNAPPPRVEPPLVVKIERGEGTDKNDLEARIKVTPEIEWVEPGDLERAVTKTPMFEKRY